MERMTPRHATALLALIAYFPIALTGCVSIKVARPGAARGMVAEAGAFRLLAVRKARDRGNPSAASPAVVAALLRLDGDTEKIVWRGRGGDFAVSDLPPGRYRIRIERLYDKDGAARAPRGNAERDFDIRPGQAAQADVVLQKTPVGLIVVLSVTVVLLVVLLVVAAQNGDIDIPDMPDLSNLLPPLPPPLFPDALEATLAFVELAQDGDDDYDDEDPRRDVRSYAPLDGAHDVAPDAPVEIELEGAIDPRTVDQSTFGLLADGTRVGAAIAVLDHGQRLRLEPLWPLPAGADVTVRLMGSHVRLAGEGIEPGGPTLGADYEWSFRTRQP